MRVQQHPIRPVLVNIADAGAILGVGPRKFRDIMAAHPAVRDAAVVILGPRCLRFRVAVLEQFADTMQSLHPQIKEPAHLAAARAEVMA
jgi:hypothetical protein